MGLLKTILRFLGVDLDQIAQQASQGNSGNRSTGEVRRAPVSGSFKANDPFQLQYRNARGEEKTITVERYSILPKGTFISACAEPTGYRIAFRKDNILNIDEISGVLELFDLFPKGNDLRTLRYHMKKGTTSPLFEELKEKYSEWVAFETGN